jgi:hypothetical protein
VQMKKKNTLTSHSEVCIATEEHAMLRIQI